ncbi:MAG: outer membrane lipoprotein-sorting protein, partial [Desulfuromusa sp.]|nr:outer membrane lipoprotein-sorting protein [Desulfuromusa sp.]
AEQIAEQVYDRDLGEDMQLIGTMELISPKGHIRTRKFISLRKDTDGERKQLIRFTAPADIKGTGFLTIEKDGSSKTEQHLYLPALKRTRRIVASQKGRSFVNSDFTYEDMQRHPVAEWHYQLGSTTEILGQPCYVLTATAKEDTETQYSRIVSWVGQEDFIPLKIVFWDKKNRQTKTYQVLNFKQIDGIATETEILMEDHLSKHKTRLTNRQIRYNSGLAERLLTTRALGSR